MPIYAYRSITPSGIARTDKIEAVSESHVKSQLLRKGEHVIQIKELGGGQASGRKTNLGKGKKAPVDEVATMVRQLSILIRAGVPIVEGMKGLAEQARAESLRVCLDQCALEVSQGTALSDVFARQPDVFPALAVEMAKIAEAGGNLSESLSRLADHMEAGAEIGRKVKSAMAYPMVVAGISLITVLVVTTFILPRFVILFGKIGAKLPVTTKIMMAVSHVMTTRWYLFIAGGVAIFHLAKRFVNSPTGRYKVDKALLKVPLIGEIVTKIVLNRVLASMSTLLESGVPMVKTLESSAAAANNEVVRQALLRARTDVAEGTATSQALRDTGVFPPLVLQMVASGEKTGELPAMLSYICTMYARETDAKVKSLTSVIEPIMIVFLGLIVGFIAMSVIVPIYSLVGGVK